MLLVLVEVLSDVDDLGDLGDWLRSPLCASQRLRSGRGGSGHTVPSSSRKPQIWRRDGDMHGDRNGDSICASSSVVARMLLYVELFRRAPGCPCAATNCCWSAHSRLLAMRISDVRNHDVNDKLPRRFGSGEDPRFGTAAAGMIRYGKQELDDGVGSGPGVTTIVSPMLKTLNP